LAALQRHIFRQFFRALFPAIIGRRQPIRHIRRHVIASLLPTGGLSSIYYAERLYQCDRRHRHRGGTVLLRR